MIKTAVSTDGVSEVLVITAGGGPSSTAIRIASPIARDMPDRQTRIDELGSHLEFLWRFACRMGIGEADAQDVAQEAFLVALSRIDTIDVGKERSFLLSVVVNMVRRERHRRMRYEELEVEPLAPALDSPDEALDDRRARMLLDRSLEALDEDLRTVFVLHEIEEETMAEIAQVLDLAPGTVASRLRRAREEWKQVTARLKRETIGSGRRP